MMILKNNKFGQLVVFFVVYSCNHVNVYMGPYIYYSPTTKRTRKLNWLRLTLYFIGWSKELVDFFVVFSIVKHVFM